MWAIGLEARSTDRFGRCFSSGSHKLLFFILFFVTKGDLHYHNGDVFQGEWKNDRANGFGILIYSNGCRYDGNWVDDRVCHVDFHSVLCPMEVSPEASVRAEGRSRRVY